MSGILATAYDPLLVLLSMGVATWASFVSLDVAARIWLSNGWVRLGWIIAAATAMGGGIWSMHFIAMLAFSLPVNIGYNIPITLLSLAIAIDVTAVAFAIVAGGRGWQRLMAAGCIMGCGVAGMHYTGMAAMRLPAEITYDPWIVAASVVIACIAATVALWIALRDKGAWWRAGAACIMGAAVYGMHYTGMEAACFTAAPSILNPIASVFERSSLALIIAVATTLILSLELLSSQLDRRFAAFRAREAEILRLSAERLKNLVQSSTNITLVVGRDGRVVFTVPSQGLLHSGLAAHEGSSLFDLIQGPGVVALKHVLMTQAPGSGTAHVDRLEIKLADGSSRALDADAANLIDEPSVNGIVLTFHDVTERERSAEELRRATQISEEANRLKSEFIANMNHELRTPLNAILGFSEIIRDDLQGHLVDGRYRDYAKDIHASGAQLLSIINDILDFSKAEVGQLSLNETTIDSATLVEDSVRFVTPAAAKKGVALVTDVPAGLPPFRGDERRLRQILLNLLSNAVKFSTSGGEVRVSARLDESGEIEFTVKDTGIGIPADQISRVMDPFYQVDGSLARQQEGTGLGLTIAKSLAELHGGRLTLESESGRGTTIRLVLPRARLIRRSDAA
jgi:signal transduction histidine kinase